jgi:hypothetical protein
MSSSHQEEILADQPNQHRFVVNDDGELIAIKIDEVDDVDDSLNESIFRNEDEEHRGSGSDDFSSAEIEFDLSELSRSDTVLESKEFFLESGFSRNWFRYVVLICSAAIFIISCFLSFGGNFSLFS